MAWVNPANINCLGFEDGNTYPGIRRHADELHTFALYATPQAAEAGGWQPIETAPRDGMIMLWDGEWCIGAWVDNEWSCCIDLNPPTHWMPLPEPPRIAIDSAMAAFTPKA